MQPSSTRTTCVRSQVTSYRRQRRQRMSDIGGRAENICSLRVFCILTRRRHPRQSTEGSRSPFYRGSKTPRLLTAALGTERADAPVQRVTGAERAVGGFFTSTDPLPANDCCAQLRRCREAKMTLRQVLFSTVAAIGIAAMAVAAP